MKWSCIIIFLILKLIESAPIDSNETRFNDPLMYWMYKVKNEFTELISSMINIDGDDINNDTFEKIDGIYDLIESLEQDCFDFILNFFFADSNFMYRLTNTFFKEGGLIQVSVGVENDCILSGTYIMFTSNNSISRLRKENTISAKEAIFKEALDWREEICVFNECRHLYLKLVKFFLTYYEDFLYDVFNAYGVRISWINFLDIDHIADNTTEMVEYKDNKIKSEEFYLTNIYIIIQTMIVFFFLVSIISWFIRANNKVVQKKIKISKKNIKYNLIANNLSENDNESENSLIQKEKKWEDLAWFKIFSSFDFLKNISLLNNKKEPLSDQTSLIELNTLKILILFFILFGENCYVILKYIQNKLSILPFFREIGFIFIKIGMNSYESYKVICGVIFGFKFINFYNKSDKFTAKKFFRFCTKPFPYILTFLIMHFLFNYPIFIFARKAHEDDYKNFYLSEIMCDYDCQVNQYNIFKIFSILGKYDYENGVKQFNGCIRPILFIISELICFYFIMILAAINISFKNRVINIIYIILFCCIFLLLALTKFISLEAKDLVDEFTISRLFGLSESLAMPYMFFGLYYIGFNLGIIYYYHLNLISNKFIADNEEKNFLPFQYCFNISSYITKKRGTTKNIFIIIFFILMFGISSIYTIIVNNINETEFVFTFEERSNMKYLCVYEGIIFGLFFACFLLFYLCLDNNTFFKNLLSSEFFIFSNKISFILFISFYSVLYYFHIGEIMEILLKNFSVFKNSLTLFLISIVFSIVFSCVILFPIKWLYLFISHGFKTEEYKQIL